MSISLKRILHPTDFSECSAVAAKYASALARAFGAELHVLHVLEKHTSATPAFVMGLAIPKGVAESRETALRHLETAIDPAELDPNRIVRAVAEGSTEQAILHYVHEHGIDLIVMGSHGRGGLERLLMGSTASATLSKAHCPVLAIPPTFPPSATDK